MKSFYDITSELKFDPNVRLIQLRLNSIREKYHHSWEKLEPDGLYGPKTKTVVQKFQQEYKITPASGVLGPTTASYIVKYDQAPILSIASSPIGNIPSNSRRPTLKGIVEGGGDAADLGSLLLNSGLPWYKIWTKFVIDAFPEVYYKNNINKHGPLFVYTKNDAYHKFGSYYNRIDIRNIGQNVPEFLSKAAYICQLLMIWNKIEEYRRRDFSWQRFLSFFAEITVFFTSSADFVVTLFPNIAEMAGGYSVAGGATAVSAIGTSGITLSAIGQMIGAFLLGLAIGKVIGNIPCGNGKIVQNYIDEFIYEIWDHPYKTIGLCPGGLIVASAIAAWKNAIEINVNRVSTLKPLTEVEKRKLAQYQLQHKEMYIVANPSMSIRALK